MHLTTRVKIQLVIISIVTAIAGSVMTFGYVELPALLGIGRYTVTVELPRAGGTYPSGNVTYQGTKIGRIVDVRLTETGVAAVLSLRDDIEIPSDVTASVHSVTALGEQYIALTPLTGDARPLADGDVVPVDRVRVPPDINQLTAATNRGLQAIPREDLRTVVDESYAAVGGLGPELARFVEASTSLAIDAQARLPELTTLIDHGPAILDTQVDSADSIQAWAASLRTITTELRVGDVAVAGILERGPGAADEVGQLFERVRPTMPVLLANLVTVAQVALDYQPNIEQLLVLVPQLVQQAQGTGIANRHLPPKYRGAYLSFNLNLNLPQPCVTGYLPPEQRRGPAMVDHPVPPAGHLYCRIPQNSTPGSVRGARNIPCATVPGKRAPTWEMCESGEQYVPLNDGFNWKGDPNGTLSGQSVPQPWKNPSAAASRISAEAERPPLSVVEYNPETGNYIAPDGQLHTRTDLTAGGRKQTWQEMLIPPESDVGAPEGEK
ncbi:MCE family protein [Mycolicibacterium thermoresistibile]|uniref:Virulence factor Mce n=2 Tax=Mycolicibacterium thermoresistibile TaxID=1797 RepID=G7CJW9_MYCT3|nr:MlaD family protein [Mycolicibacterium thermoresistibile]EHI12837.1 virulence factor Mce [Mycolicibacterium thermoresistibile ATCC 19527]MCV7189907.1 MCE family protein [Mycolicibacterium thermoresistibile]GAT14041.1 virulence factor Mce [Mycolicibacterium thermoresistibile]SNW19213.1 virulence factor Mce family protein [Mycolicibacterium thermoresistibile]